jgi:lipid-binding SYLF domain-containing protein
VTPVALSAQRPTDEVDRIEDSIEVLRELTAQPDDGIPQYLLQRAEAIVVIPEMIRGGFVIGAKHGRGIVSVRDHAREVWSPPAFVAMTGGSVGWQIGAQSVDLVLLVMNRRGVDQLLSDRFTVGGELSVVAGPVGRTANAATDVGLESQILAYSRARGLFAGATLEGVAIRADDDANEDFYGRRMTLRQIALDGAPNSRPPIIMTRWFDTLRALGSGSSVARSRDDASGRSAERAGREGLGGTSPAPATYTGKVARITDVTSRPKEYFGQQVMLSASVEDIYSRTVFAIDDDKLLSTGREVLVVAPTIRRPVTGDLDVTIVGEVIEFDKDDVEDRFRDYKLDLDDHLVDAFDDRPVILATSIRTANGEELIGVAIRDR